MKPDEFRALFPALRTTVWLDTPGAPPAAEPVADALRDTISAWSSGDFDWQSWDAAASEARTLFARWLGIEPATVSTLGSLAEAAATVAGSLPPGRIVVGANEFRSNLFPWQQRHDVVTVPARDGAMHVEDLIAALDENTTLLAVSEVTTREGQRLDLPALRAATDRVGAHLFVNLTQSLGVLRYDAAAVNPDYLAVHGYKWLLCPRGAAWLVTREDRLAELRPLAPSWKSTTPPHGYFGGPMELADDARRGDTSPAWLPWIGAVAALRLFGTLDPDHVESYCLGLAEQLTEQARAIGLPRMTTGPASQIVVLHTGHAARAAQGLEELGIRATALGDRIRFGLHYFNNEEDVDTVLRALRRYGVSA